ncbi:hypothetical protein OvHV-2gp31 [Ovine gammaherpesvirus 2]|uniref:Protein UL95 n=1 Tax=Ovine gammaherpesvirus 2 TaxID=10398 RepID=A1BM22_9GAMA|nr:hypothetical protein OvHV-2gp31 [Ovine gammaherpesvirus 2]
MLNLAQLHCDGDPELSKKYTRGVKLAISLAESTPGQFKLIESPVNSFLIVTNLSVEDTAPHPAATASPEPELDFSSLSLDRLNALSSLVRHELPERRTYARESPAPPPEGPPQEPAAFHEPYVSYKLHEWVQALHSNKDSIINRALQLLSSPQTWTFCYPTDPLPWLWLLFYGPRARCQENSCVYARYFGQPGPVLLPPLFYDPEKDIASFMSQACKYVRHFYEHEDLSSHLGDINVPFDPERLVHVVQALKDVSSSCICTTRCCLLCSIYRQNLTSFYTVPNSTYGCLILQGADQHTLSSVGRTRCLKTGDIILWPTYNIQSLVDFFISYEPLRHH